jgi:hypothetical protein
MKSSKGRTSVFDGLCYGRPSTVTCVVKKQIYQIIRDNRRIITDDITSQMSVIREMKRYKKCFKHPKIAYFIVVQLGDSWTDELNAMKTERICRKIRYSVFD